MQPHGQLRSRERKAHEEHGRGRQGGHTATGDPSPPRASVRLQKRKITSKPLSLTTGHKNTNLTKYLQLAAQNRKQTNGYR